MPSTQVFNSPLRRGLLAAVVGIAFGSTGFIVGESIGYAIARLTDRDIAELKDLLIWCMISGPPVMAALGCWLSLHLSGATRRVRRIALGVLIAVFASAGAIALQGYDWAKASGTPVVDYELRFPADTDGRRNLPSLTAWGKTGGAGCYIGTRTLIGDRMQITGTIVVSDDKPEPLMSLAFYGENDKWHGEGYWKLPYTPASTLEAAFSPWQSIDFVEPPRAVVGPLPAGNYEIRYRLKRYM